MANHKSAMKANRQSIRHNLINRSRSSQIKTFTKKFIVATTLGDKDLLQGTFRTAQSLIAKGAKKGIFTAKNASRKISKLAHKLKKVG